MNLKKDERQTQLNDKLNLGFASGVFDSVDYTSQIKYLYSLKILKNINIHYHTYEKEKSYDERAINRIIAKTCKTPSILNISYLSLISPIFLENHAVLLHRRLKRIFEADSGLRLRRILPEFSTNENDPHLIIGDDLKNLILELENKIKFDHMLYPDNVVSVFYNKHDKDGKRKVDREAEKGIIKRKNSSFNQNDIAAEYKVSRRTVSRLYSEIDKNSKDQIVDEGNFKIVPLKS